MKKLLGLGFLLIMSSCSVSDKDHHKDGIGEPEEIKAFLEKVYNKALFTPDGKQIGMIYKSSSVDNETVFYYPHFIDGRYIWAYIEKRLVSEDIGMFDTKANKGKKPDGPRVQLFLYDVTTEGGHLGIFIDGVCQEGTDVIFKPTGNPPKEIEEYINIQKYQN